MTPTTKNQLLSLIFKKNRLLSRSEAFDFYVEKVMKNDATCKLNQWAPGHKYEDYKLYELEAKAANWHRYSLGSLVIEGFLKIDL